MNYNGYEPEKDESKERVTIHNSLSIDEATKHLFLLINIQPVPRVFGMGPLFVLFVIFLYCLCPLFFSRNAWKVPWHQTNKCFNKMTALQHLGFEKRLFRADSCNGYYRIL